MKSANQDTLSGSVEMDPMTLAVMANRLDGVVREMTNTMVRTARSTTMASRDFSCSITTAENELLSSPEGVPVHVFGSGLNSRAMTDLHPELRPGDAYLHNDPYLGNTHPADHTILVPVFHNGVHVFTACAKAHQADIGNSLPTTYMPTAKDVYEEGALIFPCVKIQSDYEDVQDIIRMCQKRIRVPDIWYGDYLASLGAARLAERRLEEFCELFGIETVDAFRTAWLDYCEKMTIEAIRRLPAATLEARTEMDPFPGLDDGLALRALIEIDPVEAIVTVDLRDNPDCTATGLNLSEATAMNSAVSGILFVLNSRADAREPLVPNNAGSFRRFNVLLRDNCVVGIPTHPFSCSMATTTVAERVTGMISAAFSNLMDGIGLAEPCYGQPPYAAVISGHDRRKQRDYVLQLFSGTAGGPATAESDGYLSFENNAGAGLSYIDSSEVEEQTYPIVIWEKHARPDSEGPGRRRGGLGHVCVYGPRYEPMLAHYSMDGMVHPPKGVRGGGPAKGPSAFLVREDGSTRELESIVGEQLVMPGEKLGSLSSGGGGYGKPFTREPERVLEDVIDGYISVERARDLYGVVISGDPERYETLTIEADATRRLRDLDSQA